MKYLLNRKRYKIVIKNNRDRCILFAIKAKKETFFKRFYITFGGKEIEFLMLIKNKTI